MTASSSTCGPPARGHDDGIARTAAASRGVTLTATPGIGSGQSGFRPMPDGLAAHMIEPRME
jgi:hypothetical protein